jgi:hypothetical protein
MAIPQSLTIFDRAAWVGPKPNGIFTKFSVKLVNGCCRRFLARCLRWVRERRQPHLAFRPIEALTQVIEHRLVRKKNLARERLALCRKRFACPSWLLAMTGLLLER